MSKLTVNELDIGPLTVGGVIESTTGGVKFPDGTTMTSAASQVDAQTTARAFARFDNSGNLISGFNVSSVTDTTTGQARVNFTNAIPANSTAVCDNDINGWNPRITRSNIASGTPTTTYVDVLGHTGSGPSAHYAIAYRDCTSLHVIVFG